MEPIQDEVFQYGCASEGAAAAGRMHEYIRLPEAVDTDELADAVASARDELSGYGMVRTTHGTRSYDIDTQAFDGETGLYERISFQKLRGNDAEPVTLQEYVDAQGGEDGPTGGLEVDDWNAYIQLDGDASGVYLDRYSTRSELPGERAVPQAILGALHRELDCDWEYEQMAEGTLQLGDHMLENATNGTSSGTLYGHVDLGTTVEPERLATTVEDTMEQDPDYRVQRIPLGTDTCQIQEDGEPLVSMDVPVVEYVSVRSRWTGDQQPVHAGRQSAALSKDNWGFYIEDDGPVSGMLVDRFVTPETDATPVFDQVVDAIDRELR